MVQNPAETDSKGLGSQGGANLAPTQTPTRAPVCPLTAQRELKKHNPDSRKQRATLQNSIQAC